MTPEALVVAYNAVIWVPLALTWATRRWVR